MPALVSLNEQFFAYVTRTLVGIARVVFRAQQQAEFVNVMHLLLCQYLNMCYKSLIVGDDPQVTMDCAPFAAHSPVCLFNMMHQVSMMLVAKVDISLLDWTDLENFSASFAITLGVFVDMLQDSVSSRFMHKCSGPSRNNCDVTVPLFTISTNIDDIETKTDVTWLCFVNGCAKPGTFRCTKCKQARYCSREHQKNDWVRHKSTCKLASKSSSSPPPCDKKDASMVQITRDLENV